MLPTKEEEEVSCAAQFKIKKKILLRELNDLQQLLRSHDENARVDYEKLWTDFLVCKQKAVNFELDLPEVRKLEQQIRRRREQAQKDQGRNLGGAVTTTPQQQHQTKSVEIDFDRGSSSPGSPHTSFGGGGTQSSSPTKKKKRPQSALPLTKSKDGTPGARGGGDGTGSQWRYGGERGDEDQSHAHRLQHDYL